MKLAEQVAATSSDFLRQATELCKMVSELKLQLLQDEQEKTPVRVKKRKSNAV